jgi:hypothetical protein
VDVYLKRTDFNHPYGIEYTFNVLDEETHRQMDKNIRYSIFRGKQNCLVILVLNNLSKIIYKKSNFVTALVHRYAAFQCF